MDEQREHTSGIRRQVWGDPGLPTAQVGCGVRRFL